MFSKIWLINFVLTVLALIMGFNTYNVWVRDEQKIEIKDNKKFKTPLNVKKINSRKTLPESSYRVIVDKNLFSPDREEFIPEKTETEVKQVKISGRKITLYGVIIMDNYKKALIDNPAREMDDPLHKWVKEGDMVGDFIVATINNESILLKEGIKKYEILLYDEKKRRPQTISVNRSTAPKIVSTKATKIKLKKEESNPEIYFRNDTVLFLFDGRLLPKMKTNFFRRVDLDPRDQEFIEKRINKILKISQEMIKYLD